MLRMSIRYGSVLMLLMLSVAQPFVSGQQTAKTPDVSQFLGSWRGDVKANEKALVSGLLSQEHGLKLSTAGDGIVVASTFRRPPVKEDDPWVSGTTLAYKLDGSTSPSTFNGRTVVTKLTKDGDALVLTVTQVPGARGTPIPADVLRTMKMTMDGNRLKVEWSEFGFVASLTYDRLK